MTLISLTMSRSLDRYSFPLGRTLLPVTSKISKLHAKSLPRLQKVFPFLFPSPPSFPNRVSWSPTAALTHPARPLDDRRTAEGGDEIRKGRGAGHARRRGKIVALREEKEHTTRYHRASDSFILLGRHKPGTRLSPAGNSLEYES